VWRSESFAVIERVAAKTAAGRPPAYTAAHVLKALELIGSGSGIGRQQLARELWIGEGTARTLVKHLRSEGLVKVSRGGMILTESGDSIIHDLRRLMVSTEVPETGVTVGSKNYAVLLKGAADRIRLGVEQRDAALMAGAKGATTLLYDGAHFHMPGMDIDLDPSFAQFLLDRLKPGTGDAVIIGTADTLSAAEIGAKTAALKLLKKLMDRHDPC